MSEDGEEDAVHGGSVLKDAHEFCPSADFAEPAFGGVRCAHGLALGQDLVAKACEQFVEVVPQAVFGLVVAAGQRRAKAPAALRAARWLATFMIACRPALTALRSVAPTLSRTFLILCAQQGGTAMP